MADISYLKRVRSSDYFEDERKKLFQKIVLTDTIGKDIRSFLQDKSFNTYGVPWSEKWITESAKYFGGKDCPNKSFDIDVFIIGPEISLNQMLNISEAATVSIVIKYDDLLWHLKKEFDNCPANTHELDPFIEHKLEEKERAEQLANNTAKGKFLNTTTLRKILACSLAALAVIATCIVVIAFAGAVIFFLPFLKGISKKK